ncbi:MAG TPA: M48 family metalloprotease [Leptolyngbyaceae cyanobacterium M65_K2018_010]|nr:M48 family metalloprotease [Leptolyngbyaceae cyanobacterium M65_K2018_010]
MRFRCRLKRFWSLGLALVLGLAVGLLWPARSPAQIPRLFSLDRLQAHQIANLSWADEKSLGRAIDARFKQEGLLPYVGHDPALDVFVNRVLQSLVAVSTYPERLYTVQIVDDENVNAFATLGGYVYLNTGLLKRIDNEAELAGVLAHELGHLEERDGLNQLWLQLTVQDLTLQADRRQQRLVAMAGDLRSLSNGHASEYTADAIAFGILGRAGYSQFALVTLLQRIADNGVLEKPGFISTHPNPYRRIEQLEYLLATEQTLEATAGLDSTAYQQLIVSLP